MELTSSSKHSGSLCSSLDESLISQSGKSDPANSPAWSSCSRIAEAEAYRTVTIEGRELRVPRALFEKYEPLWTTLKDHVVLTLTPTNDKGHVIARLYDRRSHDRLRIPDSALQFVVPLMLEAGVTPQQEFTPDPETVERKLWTPGLIHRAWWPLFRAIDELCAVVDERSVGWLRVRDQDEYVRTVRFLSALKASVEWFVADGKDAPEFVPAAERYLDARPQHFPIEAPEVLGNIPPRPTIRTGRVTSYTGARGQGGRSHHAHHVMRTVVGWLHALNDEELKRQLDIFRTRPRGENPLALDILGRPPGQSIPYYWRGTPLVVDHIANEIATAVGYGLCTDELRASDHQWSPDQQEERLRHACAHVLSNAKLNIADPAERKDTLEAVAMKLIKRCLRTYGLQPDDLFKGNKPPEDDAYLALFSRASAAS